MPDTHLPLHPAPTTTERLFPTLTAAWVARISTHGRRRRITAGEILVDVGDKTVPFFVVVTGAIQILRPSGATDTLIVTHRPGEFLREGNMIGGRRALVRAQATESGEVLELARDQLLALVQTDAELSETSCGRSSSGVSS
ncbi:MAG TPA: cyclic nucleotide-binding domain-containing protein [Gemmatimonadaceae bacterium]